MTEDEPSPSRRTFLAASAGTVIGLAGCVGDDQSGEPSREVNDFDSSECSSRHFSLDAESLADPTDIETGVGDCPTPETSPLDDKLFWEWTDREIENEELHIVCSNAVSDGTPLVMASESSSFEPPDVIPIAIHNRTKGIIHGNFHEWRLFKKEDDRWFQLTRFSSPHLRNPVDPSEGWRFCLSIDDSSHRNELVEGMIGIDEIEMPALGAGEYAFGQLTAINPENEEMIALEAARIQRVMLFARFSITGDSITLTHSGYLEDLVVGETEATADWTIWDKYERDRATYVVETVQNPESYHREITEQIIRNNDEPLRDALALIDRYDIDVMRISGKGNRYPRFEGVDRTIQYQDSFYRISVDR